MIKMIRGVFGLPVNGIVKAMDKNSPPFEASAEQEKRLVERGFAEYVDGVDTSAPIGFDETPPEGDAVDALIVMNAKELRTYGKELGLTFRVGLSKADMISAIREALEGDEEEAPEGDELEEEDDSPEFDASEAVQ